MVQRSSSGFFSQPRNRSCAFLAFCWVTGLAAGILNFARNPGALSSLMRRSVYTPVSIVWLQFLFLLPFLLSAIAVYFQTPTWIFPLALCKSWSFAFVSLGLLHSIGRTGWLYQCLLLAGDFLSMPMLYLFWHRCLSRAGIRFFWPLLWFALDGMLVWNINNRFVLRFFAEIGN